MKNVRIVPGEELKNQLYELLGNREVVHIVCKPNRNDEVAIRNRLRNQAKARKRPIKCLSNGKVYESIAEASKKLGVPASSISRVINGKAKSTHGLLFERQ